jgi:hypothetical protein
MFRKTLLLIAGIFFFANILLVAQKNDSTDNKWYEFGHKDWFKFDWKFHGRPFVELNYGLSSIKLNNLVSNVADNGMFEIKLGYITLNDFQADVFTFNEKLIFGSKLSADYKSGNVSLSNLKSVTYRFGFEKRSGYGYKFDKISIMPYNSQGLIWSRIDMVDYPAEPVIPWQLWLSINMSLENAKRDTDLLNLFHNSIRFGTVNEAGVRFDYDKTLSVNLGYETAVIFPRHMFWKHLGSAIIEDAALSAVDHFVDEIADASPYVAPIASFLLKNGCSYLFYSLKKDKMNWPFDTVAPLRYETFKFGVTFTF